MGAPASVKYHHRYRFFAKVVERGLDSSFIVASSSGSAGTTRSTDIARRGV